MESPVVLSKNPNIVTRVIDGETILLPLLKSTSEINCIYTLNKSASRVWDLINGKRTLDQITDTVLKEFDTTPAKAKEEISSLLKDLKEIDALLTGRKAPASRGKAAGQKTTKRSGGKK